MSGYWIRHRLIFTLIFSGAMAAIIGLLFVFPYVSQRANDYNSQSVYKNTDVDFIIPEPSIDQVNELPGTNGIEKIFPFYLTKTAVETNGMSRTTTVLLSDEMKNTDITMYNSTRLLEESNEQFENPILVDWQFCKDTSSKIGDSVWITIGNEKTEYKISAIYETNSIYDGGAILVEISSEQKDAIMINSKNNGYSGAYVSANDYGICRNYLLSEYRPLGRLKDRNVFESEEQYQVHYDAIMSSGYANEITDFQVREKELSTKSNAYMVWIGSALALVFIIIFNVLLAKRGCEKVYFTKHCIPKGQNVKPYYSISFVVESVLLLGGYFIALLVRYKLSDFLIPKSVIDVNILFTPITILIAEIICFITNSTMVSKISRDVKKKSLDK